MSSTYKGRAILPGKLAGRALVTTTGFNAYACFYNSLREARPTQSVLTPATKIYLGNA